MPTLTNLQAVLALVALVAVLLAFLAFTVLVGLGGAWLYFRGTLQRSPLPPKTAPQTTAPPAPAAEVAPKAPERPCPSCEAKAPKWTLNYDRSVWICGACRHTVPGPEPRIRG